MYIYSDLKIIYLLIYFDENIDYLLGAKFSRSSNN